MMDAHAEQVEHQELLMGILARETVNHSFCRPKKPLCAADFMPSRSGWRAPQTKRVNRKQVANSVREFFATARAEGRVVTAQNG